MRAARWMGCLAVLLLCGIPGLGCSDDGMRDQPSFQPLEGPRKRSPPESVPRNSRSRLFGTIPSTEARLRQGERLFAVNCSHCHGTSGRGDGAVADRLETAPADLRAGPVQVKPAPVLYAIVTNGMGAMPAFRGTLSAEERWALAHYVRALDERVSEDRDGDTRE